MGRRDKRGGSKPSGPTRDPNAWMSTFSDLLMLMLTFFVLLLTMSSLDDQQIRQAMRDGLMVDPQQSDSTMVSTRELITGTPMNQAVEELRKELNMPVKQRSKKKVESLVSALFKATGLEGRAWVEHRPEGIHINVDGQISFKEGSDELQPAAQRFLLQLVSLVGPPRFNVAVETYAKGGESFKEVEAGWDLALRRADGVARFLLQRGIEPDRLRIMGFGHEAGRREKRFLRQSNLLRMSILTGPPAAEPTSSTPQGAPK